MAIETLRPNAAGDETNHTPYPDTGEANWEDVDEATPDDYSTYVRRSANTYARDLYNLPPASGSGTINHITIYFRCMRHPSSSSGYAKPSLKSDSTTTDGTEVSLTSSWTTYYQQWSTNPADSQPWEWPDINALQIGVALKGDGAYVAGCTQVYVEVDYTPVTEKTSSDAGSGADAKASGNPAATLIKTESGSGIEALFTRLLAAFDTGYGAEMSSVVTDGQLKNLLAAELGQGSDSLIAKIEMPTKGGGMKLWT